VLSILKNIFSGDTGTAVADIADNAFFTDQEKSTLFIEKIKAYEPFKLAQRLIAMTVAIPYMFAWFITFIASFFIEVQKQQALLNGDIGSVFLTVSLFYFGGGVIGSIKGVNK